MRAAHVVLLAIVLALTAALLWGVARERASAQVGPLELQALREHSAALRDHAGAMRRWAAAADRLARSCDR